MKRFFGRSKKVVFFDMNQTLIDPKRSFRIHFIELLDEFTGRWEQGHMAWDEQEVYQSFEKEWKMKKNHNFKNRMTKRKAQQLCLKKALAPYPFEFDDSLLDVFFRELNVRVRDQPLLYPDALSTLHELASKYRLAVISNGHQADPKQLGIDQLIPEKNCFTAKKHGFRKPHPKIFQTACKGMNITASEAVMVGNAWKADIQGAVRNGIDAIWIQHQTTRKKRIKKIAGKKVLVIRKLEELLQIL